VDESQRWAATCCLADGPPQRSRTIFGVPDAKGDDPPVPQELGPLLDDFGVEHIVTADDGHDLPPRSFHRCGMRRKPLAESRVLKSGMGPAAYVTPQHESGISQHLPSVLMDSASKIYLELPLWMRVA
jgi:hypothetical protein